MSFAKNVKFVSLAAAALIVSSAAFAGSDDAKVPASLSPATQMDWDAAHRDANAYANANKARTDERLLAKVNNANRDAQTAETTHVAQVKDAAPASTK
jgi:hypothetical protein